MTSSERQALALAGLLALPAGGPAGPLLDHETQAEAIDSPTPAAFTVCADHGCARRSRVTLPAAAWAPVRDVFAPPPRDAAEERARIAQAIGLLERIVGPLTDTAHDRAGDLNGFTAPGYQMDCIDESTNTTTYLRMLEAGGLLAFHRAGEPQGRGWFVTGFPHWTASVVERGSGRSWAVDSWFLDNGREPPVVPLAEWRAGWEPKD